MPTPAKNSSIIIREEYNSSEVREKCGAFPYYLAYLEIL